jgi:tRNA/tmRNA/rRNA uracil-C5-methylase (TrmA/RlmC/RlmD family)
MSDPAETQRRLILEQFTKQAVPFAEMPAHSNEESVRLLIDMAEVGPEDTVLDVACGPGLVACPLAKVARHVTGLDLTPAMIEQARAKQRATGLTNLTWLVGDAVPLPFRRLLGGRHPLLVPPLPRSEGGAGRDGAGLPARRAGGRY